ncbi:DUF397 domain-containing protein [Actinomadura madurae]|uniref:DUF397 domain-containing protein n=1 Tax=Actinomadura madurae TaxID=1993 RepID=UPI0035574BCC
MHLVPNDHRGTPTISSAATCTDPAGVRWRKSSRSGSGNCVQVAGLADPVSALVAGTGGLTPKSGQAEDRHNRMQADACVRAGGQYGSGVLR